ncbi:MAG: spermidine synthase, partial [Planctomycetota bacterium]
SITILGLFGVWIAAFVYIRFAGKGRIFARFVPIMLAAVLSIAAMKIPTGLFGIVVASNPKLPGNLLLISLEEDVTTTISLYRHLEEDALYLYTSGSRVAGDTFFWRTDQKLLGHFGIMLNKNAKNVLSVGFGSGESMSCMSQHNLERADCVEIAPEMVRFSLKHLNHINLGEKLKDKVNIIYMDAKNYIHLTDIQYDSIVNDSIHPQEFAENASLYAKEYFENARDNLSEDGLFISWIPTHNVETSSTMNSIFGTMMEVFPYVTVWYMTPHPAQYFLLVGSKNEQYFSPVHMEKELSKEGVGDSLSLIKINNSMDMMSCYIGDRGDLEKYITSYTVNSDYHPFIEFSPDRSSAGAAAYKSFIENVRSKSVYRHIDWSGMSEDQQSKWKADFERLYDASTYLCLSNGASTYIEVLKTIVQGLHILPDNPGLLSVAKRAEKNLYEKGLSQIHNGEPRGGLLLAQEILGISPESVYALMIESAAIQAHGDPEKALEIAREAVAKGSDLSDTHLNLADLLFQAGRYGQAIEEYKASLAIEPVQHRAQETLARLLIMDSKSEYYAPGEAVKAALRSCELTGYKLPDYLDVLSRAYSAAGLPEDARKITEQGITTMLSIGDKESAERLRKLLKSL